MNANEYSTDWDDPVIAELYDRDETYTGDVEMLRTLIGKKKKLKILECCSGTGRILVPLARDGHEVTGYEIASNMNARAVMQVIISGEDLAERVRLEVRDVLDGNWGTKFDLVILGGNAFWEMPSAESQENCIQYASEALKPGGHIFVDNNDYKGDLSTGPIPREKITFEGTCLDGTYGKYSVEVLDFDESTATLYVKRTVLKRSPEGEEEVTEYKGKKHPVTKAEVEGWLNEHGFVIEEVFGDREGNTYTPESNRAIFWARKV